MKHYSFLAICASAIVASCTVTNITEESSVPANEGNDAVCTVIGATISQSKTALGTPDGKIYPVIWQAGDKINVNGSVSNALTASDFDGQTAEFGFATEVESPYKAVSPASAQVSYGDSTFINVPFLQQYVEGNYDPAAAIMLGTGTDGIEFVNAMSFLKVRTSGASGAAIARLEVTSLGTEPMGGEFATTDFVTLGPKQKGNVFPYVAIVPSAPIAVGKDIIVAIPAQTYANGIKVTLQDAAGQAMMVKHESSFTAAPGKMYAFDVNFVPAAVEGTITIDGDFSDWLDVPSVSYSLPIVDPKMTNIIKLSMTADDNFLYCMVEMDETYPGYTTYMDIFVDADGDTATGGKLGSIEGFTGAPYSNSGLEWYIEGGTFYGDILKYGDSFKKYEYLGADGANIFSALSEQTSSFSGKDFFKVSGVSNGKGLGRFEFKMQRGRFGILGTKAALGIKNIIANKAAGLLPQGASTGSDFERIDMAVITMKESTYETVSKIVTIDGEFDEWMKAGIPTLSRTSDMPLTVLKTAKFTADSEYLYVYMEIDKACSFGSNPANNVMMDFYIDCDGVKTTGGTRSSVFDAGFNWYYETCIVYMDEISTWGSGQYEFTGTDGQGIFDSNKNHGGSKFVKVLGTYDKDNDLTKMEAALSRKDFKLVNTKAGVGIVLMDGFEDWTFMGKLPQSTSGVPELLIIDLPEYSE